MEQFQKAIPKSAASAAHAQTARVRFLANRREARLVCCRLTTRRGSAAGTAKWPAVANEVALGLLETFCVWRLLFGIDACMYVYGERLI